MYTSYGNNYDSAMDALDVALVHCFVLSVAGRVLSGRKEVGWSRLASK